MAKRPNRRNVISNIAKAVRATDGGIANARSRQSGLDLDDGALIAGELVRVCGGLVVDRRLGPDLVVRERDASSDKFRLRRAEVRRVFRPTTTPCERAHSVWSRDYIRVENGRREQQLRPAEPGMGRPREYHPDELSGCGACFEEVIDATEAKRAELDLEPTRGFCIADELSRSRKGRVDVAERRRGGALVDRGGELGLAHPDSAARALEKREGAALRCVVDRDWWNRHARTFTAFFHGFGVEIDSSKPDVDVDDAVDKVYRLKARRKRSELAIETDDGQVLGQLPDQWPEWDSQARAWAVVQGFSREGLKDTAWPGPGLYGIRRTAPWVLASFPLFWWLRPELLHADSGAQCYHPIFRSRSSPPGIPIHVQRAKDRECACVAWLSNIGRGLKPNPYAGLWDLYFYTHDPECHKPDGEPGSPRPLSDAARDCARRLGLSMDLRWGYADSPWKPWPLRAPSVADVSRASGIQRKTLERVRDDASELLEALNIP